MSQVIPAFLILQFRPEDDASDGEYEAMLRLGGIRSEEVERVRMERGEIPQRPISEYAGILAGGGPFNISDSEEKKGEVGRMVEQNLFPILEEIVARDIPFLGACLGLGALARALGGTVSKNDFAEVAGPADIFLTEEGMGDPLLAGLPVEFRAFTGHKEACDAVPPTATLLATSPACLVQMIRVGTRVYATQFHPELDAPGIAVRIDAYKHHGYFKPEEAEDLKVLCLAETVTVPMEILRRFILLTRQIRRET